MCKILYCLAFTLFLHSCSDNYTVNKEKNNSINFDTLFNSQTWRHGNIYTRGRMVNDLIESKILKSVSRDSLINLLGIPSENETDYCTYLFSGGDTTIHQNYLLLHIQFDSASNNVIDYWISD